MQIASLINASSGARLSFLLAVAFAITGCQDTRPPLDPALHGPAFDGSPGRGFKGAIAFHSNRAGADFNDFDIFVMNADGTKVTQLTDDEYLDFDPIWSPDGRQIAFFRFGTVGGARLMVMNEDGSGLIQLAANAGPAAWSPDGRRMLFGRNGEIFVMNADGSDERQLTNNAFADYAHAWSPNGKQILFDSDRDGDRELFVMDADGTGVTQLTYNEATDFGDHAGWSPDGRRIAFASDRDGDIEIFVMNADGSGVIQLTDNEGIWDDDPFWSPDGRHIAFHSTRAGYEQIFVMNADGTGVTQLTANEGFYNSVPVWRSRPLR